MKVLLSWLKEFAPDIDGDPAVLSDVLSALGLTVEEMTVTGSVPDSVVLGGCWSCAPIPTPTGSSSSKWTTGRGTTLQVCCGAFNMAVGDLVPLARVGTVLPSGVGDSPPQIEGPDF